MRFGPIIAAVTAIAVGGCHVHSRVDETIAGETRLRPRTDRARAIEPTLEVTAAGTLRFVEPLVCPADMVIEQQNYQIVRTRPNMATFILGLIGVSAGGVTTVIGLSDDEPASAPATYLGIAGVVAGAVMVVGPLIGNRTERIHTGSREAVRGQKPQACGSRPVQADAALIRAGNRQLFTKLRDGELAISPFWFIDAFALHDFPGLPVTAELMHGDERTTVSGTLTAADLVRGRDGFFRAIDIEHDAEPLRKVPRVELTRVEVARVLAGGQPAVEIRARLVNHGPGDAYQLRGRVSSSMPELDGLIIYQGHLPAGDEARPSVVIPIPAGAAALGDARIAVAIYDAHRTTSEAPVEFRGPVLNRQ